MSAEENTSSNESGAVLPNTDPTTNPGDANQTSAPVVPDSIPYSRFQEVVADKNEMKGQFDELQTKFEELRLSSMSEADRRKEELEQLRHKASEFDALNRQYQESQAWIASQAQTWVAALRDDKRDRLMKYAAVKGIEAQDHRALYKEGIALDALGMLSNESQNQKTPPALPTHAGQPQMQTQNGQVDASSATGAKKRLFELFSRS